MSHFDKDRCKIILEHEDIELNKERHEESINKKHPTTDRIMKFILGDLIIKQ